MNRWETPIEIVRQGSINVNNACILTESGRFTLIGVDFATKYPVMNALHSDNVVQVICRAYEHSKNLNQDHKRTTSTIFTLPDFDEWSVALFEEPNKYYGRIMLYDGPEDDLL